MIRSKTLAVAIACCGLALSPYPHGIAGRPIQVADNVARVPENQPAGNRISQKGKRKRAKWGKR